MIPRARRPGTVASGLTRASRISDPPGKPECPGPLPSTSVFPRLNASGPADEHGRSPGGLLTVELGSSHPLPVDLQMDKADNRILAMAISIKKDQPKRPVVFVTKDINLRIKADALGIIAEDYEPSSVEPDQLYSGVLV